MTSGQGVCGAKSTPSVAAIFDPKSSHANQLVAARVMVGSCHNDCHSRVDALTGLTSRLLMFCAAGAVASMISAKEPSRG